MVGDINYFYIPAANAEDAREFYGAVLGWEFTPRDQGDGYRVTNSSPTGAVVAGREGAAPHVYFHVDDIDAAVALVRKLGGQASDPDVFAQGASAECTDINNVSFGLFQPASD